MRGQLSSVPGLNSGYLSRLSDSQLQTLYNQYFGKSNAANYNRAQQEYAANKAAYDYRQATPQRFAQSTATEAQKSAQASQQRQSMRNQLQSIGYEPRTLYNMSDAELIDLFRRVYPNQ